MSPVSPPLLTAQYAPSPHLFLVCMCMCMCTLRVHVYVHRVCTARCTYMRRPSTDAGDTNKHSAHLTLAHARVHRGYDLAPPPPMGTSMKGVSHRLDLYPGAPAVPSPLLSP